MKPHKYVIGFLIIVFVAVMAAMIQADELTVRQPTEAEIGKITICPVMNLKISVREDTQVIDYKGKSYYMCCSSCVDEFKKDPDKFAK